MKARLGYRLLRPIVRFAFKMYFKNIRIDGVHNLPKEGPVILACNHPSSFLDACLLACFLPRAIHFLTRGDMMQRNLFKGFFYSTHQIPIYRFRDGHRHLRRNVETFEECYQLLGDGRVILLFVEGGTQLVKRLHPLKKGFARIALRSIQKGYAQDVPVCPVGINYQDALHGGRAVLVRVGAPIASKAYMGAEPKEQRVFTEELVQRTHDALTPLVYHLTDRGNELVFDRSVDLLELCQGSKFTDYEKLIQLITEIEGSSDLANVFDDQSIEKRIFGPLTYAEQAQCIVLNILHFTIGLPSVLSRWIAFRKISSPEFQAPVRIAIAIFLYPVFLIGTLFLLISLFSTWLALEVLLSSLLVYVFLWKKVGDKCPFLHSGQKTIWNTHKISKAYAQIKSFI